MPLLLTADQVAYLQGLVAAERQVKQTLNSRVLADREAA
jgi:hypothetical protein